MDKYDTYPIIFAEPRSGSTSLAKICSESKETNFLNEPFNGINKDWRDRIENDNESIFFYLKNFDINDGGFKHCHPNSSEKINLRLLLNSSRVLLLKRKNKVNQILSWVVADQTDKWHRFMDGSHKEDKIKIELGEIEYKTNWLFNYRKYQNYLSFFSIETKVVFYEDLFKGSRDENISSIEEVYNFFDLKIPDKKEECWKQWLSSKNKIMKEKIKERIVNLEKIKNEIKKAIKKFR